MRHRPADAATDILQCILYQHLGCVEAVLRLCLANLRLNKNLSDMEKAQYFQNIQHYSTHFKIFSLNVKMIKWSLIVKQ